MDAAALLFRERGFHGVSVDDLGASAGITGPGLYRHFASKDAVLMAVLDRLWQQLRPALERARHLPPDQALAVLLDAQLDLALHQPEAIVVLVRELRHLPDDYRERASRNHDRWVSAWAEAIGGIASHLDVEVARAMAVSVHGLIDAAALYTDAEARPLDARQRRALLEQLAWGALRAAGVDPG